MFRPGRTLERTLEGRSAKDPKTGSAAWVHQHASSLDCACSAGRHMAVLGYSHSIEDSMYGRMLEVDATGVENSFFGNATVDWTPRSPYHQTDCQTDFQNEYELMDRSEEDEKDKEEMICCIQSWVLRSE